ncbi:unnamed protein product [Allacma fusca]|uniref:Ig-like domain-containing protein n=1 Tax=Allacma fusca TaxID=39272 RepID=A0A8J2LM49_9HEXA|nr:unnamed protein product [Allacma fusca]
MASVAFASYVIFLGLLLQGTLIEGTAEAVISAEVSGLKDQSVTLPCQLKPETCGSVHSIKWYRGDRRVYIFSEIAALSRAEDDLAERGTLTLLNNNSLAQLEINPLMTADADLYKCEVTYLEVRENCALVQTIQLNTFGQYRNITEDDGTGVASSHLTMTLSRGDLGAKLECRGTSPVLETPMKAWVELDVYVRPASWEVTGYEGAVLQGTLVTLLCRVRGARPAANITWFNGTQVLSPQPSTNLAVQADGTYETQSRLIFTATRFDNGITLACQASNLVMENMGEIPYRAPTKIQVNYPPVVTISTGNVTVNETSDIFLSCEVDSNPPELISVRWYQNGELVEVSSSPDHYQGGTTKEPSLIIRNSSRSDLGVYSCVVQNQIGATQSETVSYVNVLYKPRVKLTMEPSIPVKEQDSRNVSLFCEVEAGNPAILDAVRWSLNGSLLKELPECLNTSSLSNHNNSDLCDGLDPSKLLLENVDRYFHGNYTCEGRNEAGWGDPSPNTELHVHYPPGAAKLEFKPTIAVKGQAFNMYCIIDENGYPAAKTYRWTRGNHVQNEIHSYNWTIFPVSLETRANFSCEALNAAGQGPPATLLMEVFAPPMFIERLQPYRGAITTAKEVSISCQVECYPLCDIIWLKDGLPLSETEFYTIKKSTLPPDETKSDFESVVSTLIWNLTAWPGGQLDRLHDNANYTCQSTANEVGPGVSSTTSFRVEYAPECTITQKESDDALLLVCEVEANPGVVDFQWMLDNGTYDANIVNKGRTSTISLISTPEYFGKYKCFANNSIGLSVPCERVISGSWIRKLSDDKIIFIAAIVGAAIVLFLIACIIIILVCRRKRMNEKYPSPAHRKGDLSEDDKAYYENLPFHGLQSPQSKLKQLVGTGEVRPPSELSQTGSSGYGSTRSQKDTAANPTAGTALPSSTTSNCEKASTAPTVTTTATTTTTTTKPSTPVTTASCSSVASNAVTPNPGSTKPVNVVKPSTEQETLELIGPKTSTPIPSVFLPDPTHVTSPNVNNMKTNCSSLGRGSSSASKIPSPIVGPGTNNPTNANTPPTSKTSFQNTQRTGSVSRIKLATVRPQRISSSGSLRPFRVPEAPKILFRSVRGVTEINSVNTLDSTHANVNLSFERSGGSSRKSMRGGNFGLSQNLSQSGTLKKTHNDLSNSNNYGSSSSYNNNNNNNNPLNPSSLPNVPGESGSLTRPHNKQVASKSTSNLSSSSSSSRANNTQELNNNSEYVSSNEKAQSSSAPLPAPRAQTMTNKSRRHTYQNIPFTRKTPKHEPYVPTEAEMDYADQDYKQFYSYGPINYKEASLQAAKSKENNNVRRAVESEML